MSEHNRSVIESKKETDENTVLSINTSMGLLSPDLLKLFEIEANSRGCWFFNVYVEFVPMFREDKAKDWQR